MTDLAHARISPKWWPGNAGAALVARAMRSAYDCEGTSTRQHNEPAGSQDVWHLHVHVFPRYADDGLYVRDAQAEYVDPSARQPYADLLAAKIDLPRTFTG